MRLLNVTTLEFARFSRAERPKYVTASHRWSNGSEATFKDIRKRRNTESAGYEKVKGFITYVRDSLPSVEWLWMDTCCINQEDAAELSEAVNLMFEWYRNAEVCVAYLADVNAAEDKSSFEQSEWFERGWTLQELLAPKTVVFLTKEWKVIGNKGGAAHTCSIGDVEPGLEDKISRITGIPEHVLHDYRTSVNLTVEEKLKWMEGRTTTREEDMSYALYGIFGVAPGANYGERGDRARQRLLDAIHHQDNLAAQQADRFQKIAAWLSPADPWTNHKSARQLHEPRTGAWLVQSDQYRKWKEASIRSLWIYGKVGCGKTILCSTAIEDVKTHCKRQPNAGYAVFYFSFSDNQKQRHTDLLHSLVVQLGWKGPALSMLQQAYDKPNRSLPGVDELEKILLSCFESYEKVFLLVDALDECPEDGDVRHTMLECLARLSQGGPHVRILTTSREVPDIRESMTRLGATPISIATRSVDVDIRQYMATQLSRNHRLSRLDPATKTLIEETISVKADGMFRWAYCQLQELKKLKSTRPKVVKEALYSLPKTLDETYERILTGIEDVLRTDALTLLRWLAYAKSPPSLGELVDATVIDVVGEGSVEVEDRPGVDDTLEILSGLVIIERIEEHNDDDSFAEPDDETGPAGYRQQIGKDTKFRLAHFSVKEYLESKRILQGSANDFYLESAREHRILSQSCLVYLMHYSSSEEKLSTEQDLTKFPLLLYAAQSWFYHSALQQTMDSTHEEGFLCHQDAVHDWLRIYQPDRAWQGAFRRLQQVGSSLYYASAVGLEAVVVGLLKAGADVNMQGGLYGNALQVASLFGHEKVLQRLINAGAHINAQKGHHVNALLAASIEGHAKIVQLLLEHGAESTTDHNNMTALHYAVHKGHEAVCEILLDAGIPIDLPIKRRIWRSKIQDDERLWSPRGDPHLPSSPTGLERGLTPLHYAVLIGSVTMTKFLLERGANSNAISEYGETPLHLAIKREVHGPDWAKGFVDHWNDPDHRVEHILDLVDIEDEEEYSLAQAGLEAVRSGILEMLFAHRGMDPSIEDCFDMGPLHCVPYGSSSATGTLRMLLQRGVKIGLQDTSGRTALHLACSAPNVDAIQLLVDNGAMIQDTENTGLNALHLAARSGDDQAIDLVLKCASEERRQAFAQTKDYHGQNALHCLLGGRGYVHIAAVQRLTAESISVNDLTDNGESPLSIYFASNWLDRSWHKAKIVDHLFRAGADPSFKTTKDCLTFAHLAASADEVGVELLKVLVEYGVDLHAEDDYGRTMLHHCALSGSIEEENALKFLCGTIGLSIDSCDKSGMTPLALATQKKMDVDDPNLFRSDRWARTESLLKGLKYIDG